MNDANMNARGSYLQVAAAHLDTVLEKLRRVLESQSQKGFRRYMELQNHIISLLTASTAFFYFMSALQTGLSCLADSDL